jgi:adenylate cyclase
LRRIVTWAVLLAAPAVGLALLLAYPRLDVHWENQPPHFWLVLAAGILSGGLAFLTGEAAARRGDTRVLRLSIAFACASGFLGLHALATPGVLLAGKNAGFQVAAAIGLLLAAPVAAWSAVELDRGPALIARRGILYAALGLVLGLWAAVSLATLPPLDEPIEDPGPLLLGIFAVGALLYAFAAAAYVHLYLRRRRALLLAAVAAFVLLAEAMLAVGLGRNWHATWWEWHLLMLLAFALFARSAWREWQREGSPAEIWADLYEDATWGREEDVSVLFADLQGFTRYAESHGETDVTRMLDAYFEAVIPGVRSTARNVRTIGDAVMAYFTGKGHERHAAVAALQFQAHAAEIAAQHPGWPRFRVGVNSGRAHLGITAQAREETVRGDAINVAARLEGQARAGEVVLGEATWAALGNAAVVEDLGELPVKGKERPVRAYVLRSLATDGQKREQGLQSEKSEAER